MPTYYDEKTKTYYTSFYYKDFSGTNHRKLKRGFKLQREAKEYERDFIAKMQGSDTMTFAALANYFLQDLKTRAKPTTIETATFTIEHYLKPTFEKLQANTIRPAAIKSWQHSLIEKGLSKNSIATFYRFLTMIFKYGVKYYGLNDNPCSIVSGITRGKPHNINYWTLSEFNLFIKALTEHHKPNARHSAEFLQTVYNTFFYCGLRKGELLALTIGDYNRKEQTLTINKTLTRIGEEDVITEPKTPKSNRTVSLPHQLCIMLDEHISKLEYTSTNEPLFPKLTKGILFSTIKKFSELAEVKRIRIHDLRHSHASMLINLGVQPLAISERLGHENIQTTLNIYSHLYPNTAGDIADQLDTMIKKQYQNSITNSTEQV